MADRAILDIEINTDEFQRFQKLVAQYSEQLKNTSNYWTQTSSAIDKMGKQSRGVSAAFKGLATDSKNIAKNLSEAATHMIKISTIMGALTALIGLGGGLFGLDRLSRNIMERRRQVMGLGGNFGATGAFQNYAVSAISSPTSLLQNIALAAQGDPTRLRALGGLGISREEVMSKDPTEIALEVMERLPQRLKPGQEISQARAQGLTSLMGEEDILSDVKAARQGEIADIRKKVEQNAKDFDITEKAQKGLSDLALQFSAAGTTIKNIIGEKLAALGPTLGQLSNDLVQIIKDFANSPLVSEMLGDLHFELQRFDTFLKSPEFKDAFKDFLGDLKDDYEKLKGFFDVLIRFGQQLRPVVEMMEGLTRKTFTDRSTPASPGVFGQTKPWLDLGPLGTIDPRWNKTYPNRPPSYIRGGGAAGGGGFTFGTEPVAPTAQGTYRPVYKLSDADLSDDVVNTVAGEARTKDPASVDAVIDNLLNRVGSRGYGPSGNLQEVAMARGQYAGHRKATPEEAAMIRARIRAIASGGVSDITKGAMEYRASSYFGQWRQRHPDAPNIGGNVYGKGIIKQGPYGPYDTPHIGPYVQPPDASAAVMKAAPPAVTEQRTKDDIEFSPAANGRQASAGTSQWQGSTRQASLTIRNTAGSNVYTTGASLAGGVGVA
jgi:hypothetical protein